MGNTRRLAGCLLVFGCLAASGAQANMVLSEVILDMASDERRRDIEVWNSGTDMLYIQVEVSRVLDPVADKPQREKLSDPRTAGLLATPNLMALTPDERKLLRVVVRQAASDTDLVYRVSLIPKQNQGETDAKLAFKVLIGYEVLVIVRPPGARPRLQVERNGRQLRMSNTGNSSILVRKMDQCLGIEEGCPELPGNRLYAGETWDTELPKDAPVRVFQSFGSENSVQSY
jgi:P pilus assembly chaperone PapD